MINARKWTKWVNKIGFLHTNQYQNIMQSNGGRSWPHEWTLTGNRKRQQSVWPWGDHYSVSFKPITAITEFSISLLICLRSTLDCSPGGCRDWVCVNIEAIVLKHSDSFVLVPYCSTNAIMAVRLKRWLSDTLSFHLRVSASTLDDCKPPLKDKKGYRSYCSTNLDVNNLNTLKFNPVSFISFTFYSLINLFFAKSKC